MKLHLQIYGFPSPWKKINGTFSFKNSSFYTFLIDDHPTGDFKVQQWSAHSGKEFQTGRKAVPESWCYWAEANAPTPSAACATPGTNRHRRTQHWSQVRAYPPKYHHGPWKSLRLLKDQTLEPFHIFEDFLPAETQPFPCQQLPEEKPTRQFFVLCHNRNTCPQNAVTSKCTGTKLLLQNHFYKCRRDRSCRGSGTLFEYLAVP